MLKKTFLFLSLVTISNNLLSNNKYKSYQARTHKNPLTLEDLLKIQETIARKAAKQKLAAQRKIASKAADIARREARKEKSNRA